MSINGISDNDNAENQKNSSRNQIYQEQKIVILKFISMFYLDHLTYKKLQKGQNNVYLPIYSP